MRPYSTRTRNAVPRSVTRRLSSQLWAGVLVVACTSAVTLLAAVAPVSADTTTGWAAWTPITGRANDYATTMSLPAGGFPRAVVASDSRANVALPSGASTYLGPSTPVGAKYGTSRNQAYLNLRPRADSPTTPSTTTYTFDSATPPAGWTFVLGDVDADEVTVRAADADGHAVPAATIDRWYRSSFNYAGDADVPTWNAATSTLRGNAAAADTEGASAWFEPDVALSSLTFVYTARSGFPIYQTWFASVARTISGQVTDASNAGHACPIDDSVLRLLAPDGTVLATMSPTGGAYSFGQYATQDGYRVTLEPPPGCALESPEQRTLDTTNGDATADFALRAVVPQPVGGTVTTTTGTPVPDVGITLTPPGGGPTRTTTTDADGSYLFDDNAEVDGYTVAVNTVPDGYDVAGAASHGFDITPGVPVPEQDFSLAEQPSVQGTVSGGGGPLGGVTVDLMPVGGGTSTSTATTGDGSYEFPHVPAGQYDITVVPPAGYRPAADLDDVTVRTAGVTGQDFDLTRPGAVSGEVATPDGTPVADVDVHVDSTGSAHALTTDASGEYYLGDLDAGDYRIDVTAPDGFRAVGVTHRSVTVTAAGEVRGGVDFVLATVTSPSAPPSSSPASVSPTSSTSSTSSTPSSSSPPSSGAAPTPTTGGTSIPPDAGSGGLASTGTDVLALLIVGLAAVGIGAAVSLAGRRGRQAGQRRRPTAHE